jgi:hypothetical protein
LVVTDDGVVALAATFVDDALTVGFTAALAVGFEIAFAAAFRTATEEGFVFDEDGFAGVLAGDFFVAMI